VFGVRGFRVSPGHFAERFSLIVIIALGESIVAVGAGLTGDLDAGIVTGAIFGLVLACALWWAYFDVIVLEAERRFRSLEGHERLRMARDAYSYLHLPMVAGIVLIALGIKKTIAHVDVPLDTVPAVALFGGVALYHGAHVAFRMRLFGTVNRQRLVAAVSCLPLIWVAMEVDALVALGLAAAVASAVIAYEALRYADTRERVRAGNL
jgi:low temperature requirement protein LtrA